MVENSYNTEENCHQSEIDKVKYNSIIDSLKPLQLIDYEAEKSMEKSGRTERIIDDINNIVFVGEKDDGDENDIEDEENIVYSFEEQQETISKYPIPYIIDNQNYRYKQQVKENMGLFNAKMVKHNDKNAFLKSKVGTIKELVEDIATYTDYGMGMFMAARYSTKEEIVKDKNNKESIKKERKVKYEFSNLLSVEIDGANIDGVTLLESNQVLKQYVAGVLPSPSNLLTKGVYHFRYLFVTNLFDTEKKQKMNEDEYYKEATNGLLIWLNEIFKEINDIKIELPNTYDKELTITVRPNISIEWSQPKFGHQIIRVGKGSYYYNEYAEPINVHALYNKSVKSRVASHVDKAIHTSKSYEVFREGKLNSGYYSEFDKRPDLEKFVLEEFGKENLNRNHPIYTDRDSWISFTYALVNSIVDGYLDEQQVFRYYSLICIDDESNEKIKEIYGKVVNNPMRELNHKADMATIGKYYKMLPSSQEYPERKPLKDFYIAKYNNNNTIKYKENVISNEGTIEHDLYQYFKKNGKTIEETPLTEKYIGEKNFIRHVLHSEEGSSILLDAPTGSGKTHALFHGLSSFYRRGNVNTNDIVLVCFPNTLNVTQNKQFFSSLFDEGKIFYDTSGLNKWFKKDVRDAYVKKGCRIFVSTYESALTTYYSLTGVNPSLRINHLIVDEIHSFTSDASYRENIQNLAKLVEDAIEEHEADTFPVVKRFCGMTGTPNIVPIYLVNELRVYKTKEETLDFREFEVVTVNSDKHLISAIADSIKNNIDKGNLLFFIENKTIIQQVQDLLDKEGIKSLAITSKTKNDEEQNRIIQNAKYDDYQVILATSAIGKGVTFYNKSGVVCVCSYNMISNNYCPSVVRQMVNRFREPFEKFIWIRPDISKEDIEKHSKTLFSLHGLHSEKLIYASKIKSELEKMIDRAKKNADLIGEVIHLKRDIVEKENGIYFKKSLSENGYNVIVDKLHVLANAYEEIKEKRRSRLLTFQKELEVILGKEVTRVTKDEKEIFKEVPLDKKKLNGEEMKELEVFIDNFERVISRYEYKQIVESERDSDFDSDGQLRHIKDKFNVHAFAFLLHNRYIPYSVFSTLLNINKKKLSSKKYYDTVKTFVNILGYTEYNRINDTKTIINEIIREFNHIQIDEEKEQELYKRVIESKYYQGLEKEEVQKVNQLLKDNIHTYVNTWMISGENENDKNNLYTQTKDFYERRKDKCKLLHNIKISELDIASDSYKNDKSAIEVSFSNEIKEIELEKMEVIGVLNGKEKLILKTRKETDFLSKYYYDKKSIALCLDEIATKLNRDVDSVKQIFHTYFKDVYIKKVSRNEELEDGTTKEKRYQMHGILFKNIHSITQALDLTVREFAYLVFGYLLRYEVDGNFTCKFEDFIGISFDEYIIDNSPAEKKEKHIGDEFTLSMLLD